MRINLICAQRQPFRGCESQKVYQIIHSILPNEGKDLTTIEENWSKIRLVLIMNIVTCLKITNCSEKFKMDFFFFMDNNQ